MKKSLKTKSDTKCAVCWNEQNPDEDSGVISSKDILETLNTCKTHTEQLETNMQNEFPKSTSTYLKTAMFQDTEVPLTYLGWDKKANEDKVEKGKVVSTWQSTLKFCLRYSFPEMAKDEAGQLRLDKNGKPFKNSNYDPNYPQGYSIVYHFAEGDLETGSLPLFNAFCGLRPSPNELVLIFRTGTDKETKWRVKRASGAFVSQQHPKDELPSIQLEANGDEEIPPF